MKKLITFLALATLATALSDATMKRKYSVWNFDTAAMSRSPQETINQ